MDEIIQPTEKIRNDFAAFLREYADKPIPEPTEWQKRMMQDIEDEQAIEAEFEKQD